MENKSLAILVGEMSLVLNQIVEMGGELSPELEAQFDNIGAQIQTKTDSYAFFMDRLGSEAEFWKAKAEVYTKVSRSCAKLRERLNDSIKQAMCQLNTDEVKGEEMRFKLSKLAPKLVIEEPSLPSEYKMVVTTMVPDKERIKYDLSVGVQIVGARMEDVFTLRKYANKRV